MKLRRGRSKDKEKDKGAAEAHPKSNSNSPQKDSMGFIDLSWKCWQHVGDMSATLRNVADFRPDRANLATWFLVCRLTFVSLFSDMSGPRTDNICT